MKIITVVTFHNRPKISEIFWAQCNEIGLDVIAVVTREDKENINLANKYAIKVIQAKNNNLPRKWQYGISELKNYDFDYFLLLGSDDLISHRFFTDICQKEYPTKYFGLRDALAISMDVKLFRYWGGYPKGSRHNESIGPGRMLHKSVLDELDFNLFNKYTGSLDSIYHRTVESIGITGKLITTGPKPYRIGLKSDFTINKRMQGVKFNLDISLKGYYSQDIINMIYD